ncbi:MAG: pantoate--beta-alanine ligase [Candidatus Neomarinimicrobiota bacterium]|jgi:pantoate--beta-alanine ligase
MERISNIQEMQKRATELRLQGKKIGFVPTMGYLHEGHLSLVDAVRKSCDVLVMSIFVNPTQFGPNEDLDTYPRDIERDEALAKERGVDIVFYPHAEDMFPDGSLTWVNVEKITEVLCGASRAGHFRGVTTVLTKLINILKPHEMVMGQKDAQQAAVVTKMVEDLNMDLDVIVAPIVREDDGLAMSSRNTRLSPENRKQALVLSRSLKDLKKELNEGLDLKSALENARQKIELTANAQLEYLEARRYPSLELTDRLTDRTLIAVAVKFAGVRLIDNILVKHEK